MKRACKSLANGLARCATWPLAISCHWQERLHPGREEMFGFWSQVLALIPGLLGVYLRRGFYRQTLASADSDFHIGFGAFFTHRAARIESGVYVGPYALIGSAVLRRNALIGSRASLLSGGHQHELDAEGNWTLEGRIEQIEIGENAWLGEAAVVMANVGSRAMVSAGAVVSTAVPERVMVAGNPARFVKRLVPPDPQPQLPPVEDEKQSGTNPLAAKVT